MNGVGSLQISPLAWKFVVSDLVRYKVIDIKVSSDVVDADVLPGLFLVRVVFGETEETCNAEDTLKGQ